MEQPSPFRNTIGSTKETRWLKRILLLFWSCRCCLLLSTGITWVASLVWMDQTLTIPGNLLGASIAVILLITLCISLDLALMILLVRHALLPATFLVFQAVQTMIWGIVMGIEVFVAEGLQGSRDFLAWFLSFVVHLMFLALFAYACVFHYRARKQSLSVTSKDGLSTTSSTLSLAPQAPQLSHESAAETSQSGADVATAPPPSYEDSQRSSPPARRSFIIVTLPDEITQPSQVSTSRQCPRRYA